MKVDTYKCDVCGVEKKVANRWWILWIRDDGLALDPWEKKGANPAYAHAYHVCGEAHGLELVSRFMQTGSLVNVFNVHAQREAGKRPTSMPSPGGAS